MADRINSDDTDFEISFCENLLQNNPNFVSALVLLGDHYTKKGLYEKGLAIDEKLERLKPQDPHVLYNLSCSYSLTNNIDKALATIKRAVDCGYHDYDYILQDADLINLRGDGRFKEFFAKLTEDSEQEKVK
jgi:tetratricopeptide (TPR) repeat protein